MVMLKPFEPAVRQGHAMAVMAAYHEIDGIPVTDDPFLLEAILRQEWGFKGFVLSDLGAIKRLYTVHHFAASPKDATCIAIRSGVDMQFYDFGHEVFQKALIDCVKEGSPPQADVDRAVLLVRRVKFVLGLFDQPMVDSTLNPHVYRSPAYLALSLESAREPMTLLKNDDHLLPLSTATRHIAVIGPHANVVCYGDYEDESNCAHISMLEGIRKLLPHANVTFDEGKGISAAVATARAADIVILGLGERKGIVGEGYDRSKLVLPGWHCVEIRMRTRSSRPAGRLPAGLFPILCAAVSLAQSGIAAPTTAWQGRKFHIDAARVIGRSDIVLGRPNIEPGQAMPLGNGRLGAAVWSAEGFTAQLNRAEALPGRLSPGQVGIPGLSALAGAPDYLGKLDLYDGEIREQGGGMTASIYMEPNTDTLVIDVTGANPNQPQTAQLRLWQPRTPYAVVFTGTV